MLPAGTGCTQPLTNVNGVCTKQCGDVSGECCVGTQKCKTTSLACVNNKCVDCGGEGEPICTGVILYTIFQASDSVLHASKHAPGGGAKDRLCWL
jgi:hypothetical protein